MLTQQINSPACCLLSFQPLIKSKLYLWHFERGRINSGNAGGALSLSHSQRHPWVSPELTEVLLAGGVCAQSSHRLAPPCAPQLAVSALSTSSAVSFWKRKSQTSLKSIITKRLKVANCFSEGTAGGEGGEGKKRKRRNRIVVLRAYLYFLTCKHFFSPMKLNIQNIISKVIQYNSHPDLTSPCMTCSTKPDRFF